MSGKEFELAEVVRSRGDGDYQISIVIESQGEGQGKKILEAFCREMRKINRRAKLDGGVPVRYVARLYKVKKK